MEFTQPEFFISVDVETAGPTPSQYSLLSIGACVVFDPLERFYVELQPINEAHTAEAMQIAGMDLSSLKKRGQPPREAMERFAAWVERVTPDGRNPIFVAFNAPFDWMFIADYFQRVLGRNPFGHKAIDIKAFYMGHHRTRWDETGYEKITARYGIRAALPHNALEDAVIQAHIFRTILEDETERNLP